MKLVKFEKFVDENYIRENVYNFEYKGEGIYKFEFCDFGVCRWEKVSNNNEIEVMDENEIVKFVVGDSDDWELSDIKKLREFVYSGWEDDDLGNEDLRYILWLNECENEEFYWVK